MREASKSQEVTEDKLIEYTDTMVRIYRYIIDAILVDICTVEVGKKTPFLAFTLEPSINLF